MDFIRDASNLWWLLGLAILILAAFGVLLWWVLFENYSSGSSSTSLTTESNSRSSDPDSSSSAGAARVTSAQLDSIIASEFDGEDVVVLDPFGILYKSVPQEKDNLQEIKGVGPVLEKKINEFGVYRFKQIANWPDAAIDEFQELLSFPDRIRRDDWVNQAASLAKGINPNV